MAKIIIVLRFFLFSAGWQSPPAVSTARHSPSYADDPVAATQSEAAGSSPLSRAIYQWLDVDLGDRRKQKGRPQGGRFYSKASNIV
jgi:hypothetical protein